MCTLRPFRRFSDLSCGRQCAFMNLLALLSANVFRASQRTAHTVDHILIARGNAIYLKFRSLFCITCSLENNTISLLHYVIKVKSHYNILHRFKTHSFTIRKKKTKMAGLHLVKQRKKEIIFL